MSCQTGLLQLSNGPDQARRGPSQMWTLWTDPKHWAVAHLKDQGDTFGWPVGDEWPARGEVAMESDPLSVPRIGRTSLRLCRWPFNTRRNGGELELARALTHSR